MWGREARSALLFVLVLFADQAAPRSPRHEGIRMTILILLGGVVLLCLILGLIEIILDIFPGDDKPPFDPSGW